MAKKVLKVAIAGQGRSGYGIHARWMRTVPQQYEIVAVADQEAPKRSQASKEFGCRTYKDYTEMIRDKDLDIDLFVNALPSFLHPKGTIAALKAGHNVVCEKPAAVKVADFDKVLAAAKKARRLFAPFQNSRFFPFFQKMQDIIASGVLGEIVHIRSTWSGFGRRWDWQTLQKNWGGNLNNTGPHPMDHAVVLFGKKMPNVFSVLRNGAGSVGDADDFALAVLSGKGSPTVEVLVSSYLAYPQGDLYSVNGMFGGMAANREEIRWRHYDPAKNPKLKLQRGWAAGRSYCGEKLRWTEKSWKLPDKHKDHFQICSGGFYDNLYDVLVNKGKLRVDPSEVRRQIAVIEECHRQNPLPKKRT